MAVPIADHTHPVPAAGNDRGDDDPFTTYDAVINHEEQFSIWPSELPLPPGWRMVGLRGPKADCLAFIAVVWTDMRPWSLRRAMDGDAARSAWVDIHAELARRGLPQPADDPGTTAPSAAPSPSAAS